MIKRKVIRKIMNFTLSIFWYETKGKIINFNSIFLKINYFNILIFRFSKEITPIKQRNSSLNSQGEKSSKSSAQINSTRVSKWNNENVNNQNFVHRRCYSKDKKIPLMFNNFIQPEMLHIGIVHKFLIIDELWKII